MFWVKPSATLFYDFFFVYNRLKPSFTLKTNTNRFLQISFFHRNLIYIYFFKKAYCACCDLDTSLQLCVSHLFASLILLCRIVLYQGHIPRLMRKKKLTKFVYFLETMMYKCLIFWTNIMVHINLVVNFVLFWRVYVRETPLDLNKTWVDNVRFSISVVCTKN